MDAVDVISFDFMPNLPMPNLSHSDVFYLCQMWMYMFGIHNLVVHIFMYKPTAQLLALWFHILMCAVGKTKSSLLLACRVYSILQGVTPSSGTTLTSAKSRRGRQVPQSTFQVIGLRWSKKPNAKTPLNKFCVFVWQAHQSPFFFRWVYFS